MPRKIVGARIAFVDMNLMKFRLHMGVQVVIKEMRNLDAIRQRSAPSPLSLPLARC
jgi:hypothetical protein